MKKLSLKAKAAIAALAVVAVVGTAWEVCQPSRYVARFLVVPVRRSSQDSIVPNAFGQGLAEIDF